MSPEQLDLFQNPLQQAQNLKRAGKLAQARALLEKLVQDNSENISARAALADLYYRVGNFKGALAQAAEILRRDPKEPRALVVSGNVMLEKNQPAAAAEYFSAALEIAPTDYLRLRLAECQLRMGRPEAGAEILKQVEGERRTLAFLHLLFWQLVQQEEEAQAREVFVQAISLATDSPEVFARQMLKFLSHCSSAMAVNLSELARKRPGQEHNPYLIIYEAGLWLRLRQPKQAEQLLESLSQELTPELLREKQKLTRRLARLKHRPSG